MKDDEFSQKKKKDDETLALSVADKRPLVLDKFKESVTNQPPSFYLLVLSNEPPRQHSKSKIK